MTNYNYDRFVGKAVRSVLAQTLRDFEFIIVDDSSTDRSREILREFARRDGRIKLLFNDSNMGPSYSRNRALKIASAPFICFMDSDDLIKPERTERMVNALASKPRCIAYTHFAVIDENDSVVRRIRPDSRNFLPEGDAHVHVLREWIWGITAIMMPSSATKEVGYFDESLRYGEDLDYLIRLTEKYGVTVIPEDLYFYRKHMDSSTGSTGAVIKDSSHNRVLDSKLRRDWNDLDDFTKYRIILRILTTSRLSSVRTKIRWLLNPFFIRASLHGQRKKKLFEEITFLMIGDLHELYAKLSASR